MDTDFVWIEIILIILGLTLVIIAFFKPKDNNELFEEKFERLLEDFIIQIDLENEEMLKKIRQVQSEAPVNIDERLAKIEQKLVLLEQNMQIEQSKQLEQIELSNTKPEVINQKHEEIINLYQNGDDIDTIAKKMQMGHAEITLILELSKKGFNYV